MELPIQAVRDTLTQLQRNLGPHVIIGVVFAVFTLAITFVFVVPMIGLPLVFAGLDPDQHFTGLLGVLGGTFFVVMLLALPMGVIYSAYIGVCVREAAGGPALTPGAVKSLAVEFFWPVVLTNLLVTPLVLIGMIFCYFPGILVVIATWHACTLVVIGGRRPVEAILESFEMARANPMRELMLYLGLFFLSMVGSMIPMIGVVVTMPVVAVYSARATRISFPDVGTALATAGQER